MKSIVIVALVAMLLAIPLSLSAQDDGISVGASAASALGPGIRVSCTDQTNGEGAYTQTLRHKE